MLQLLLSPLTRRRSRRRIPISLRNGPRPSLREPACSRRSREYREQLAELPIRETQLDLQERRRDRKIAAVDVVDENRESQQEDYPVHPVGTRRVLVDGIAHRGKARQMLHHPCWFFG